MSDKTETGVSALLEPDTPLLVLAEIMDKLKPYALLDTLQVSRGVTPAVQEMKL